MTITDMRAFKRSEFCTPKTLTTAAAARTGSTPRYKQKAGIGKIDDVTICVN